MTDESVNNNAIQLALGRLEGKLDVAITQQTARLDEHSRHLGQVGDQLASHDIRLRVVENRTSAIQATAEASKPKSPWPQVSAMVAAAALLLALAAAVYSR